MHLIIHTDGGSRGNPGPAAAGVVIHDSHGNELFAAGFFLGRATNNVAEYTGVIRALEHARRLDADKVELFSDSELLVRQIAGQYRVKSPALRELYQQARALLDSFDSADVRHVYRTENTVADALVNAALDAGHDVGGEPAATSGSGSTAAGPAGQLDAPLHLADRVPDPLTTPHREMLRAIGPLATELLCLPPGQSVSLDLARRNATLTVMKGRGQLTLDEENHTLRPGSWFFLASSRSIALTAGARSSLVAVLTTA